MVENGVPHGDGLRRTHAGRWKTLRLVPFPDRSGWKTGEMSKNPHTVVVLQSRRLRVWIGSRLNPYGKSRLYEPPEMDFSRKINNEWDIGYNMDIVADSYFKFLKKVKN